MLFLLGYFWGGELKLYNCCVLVYLLIPYSTLLSI